jgi:hypothetical protein
MNIFFDFGSIIIRNRVISSVLLSHGMTKCYQNMSFAIWLNFLKVHGNAIVMVIKTIAFTIILKFHSPDGIFSKRIKNKKKIGIEEIVQIYVPSL